MTEGIITARFAINKEEVHYDLDRLIGALPNMKETYENQAMDSLEEWTKISFKFDSLMEDAAAIAVKREKLEELSPLEPSIKKRIREDDLSMRDLLKQREKMHLKELMGNRRSIINLVVGKMKLAENFKSCVTLLCAERDRQIRKIEAEIETLKGRLDESEHAPRVSVNVITLRGSKEEVPANSKEDSMTDAEILARFEVNKAKYDAAKVPVVIDREKDDEYVAKLYGVDRRPVTVDRQVRDEDVVKYSFTIGGGGSQRDSDDDGFTSDEEDLVMKYEVPVDEAEYFRENLIEQIKYVGLWKTTPEKLPILVAKAPVMDKLQEEEGKPQPTIVLEKDTTQQSIFLDCMVEDVNKPLGLCQIDTGAAINVTSIQTINRLGIAYTKSESGLIELLGGELIKIQGVAEDVTLRIGGALVKIDLHIIDTGVHRIGKTILGTGFMLSVGAVINFDTRRVSFNKIDPNKYYHWVDVLEDY